MTHFSSDRSWDAALRTLTSSPDAALEHLEELVSPELIDTFSAAEQQRSADIAQRELRASQLLELEAAMIDALSSRAALRPLLERRENLGTAVQYAASMLHSALAPDAPRRADAEQAYEQEMRVWKRALPLSGKQALAALGIVTKRSGDEVAQRLVELKARGEQVSIPAITGTGPMSTPLDEPMLAAR